MKRLAVLVLCVFLTPLGARADSEPTNYEKHEKILNAMIKGLDGLADALESVKDQATAKTAAGTIDKICDRFDKIPDEAKSLPKLNAEDDQKLRAAFEPQLAKAVMRLQPAAVQAGKNAGGEETFIKSAKRLVQVGKKLQTIGNWL